MYLWNRQFVVNPGRFFEGLSAIMEASAYTNSNLTYKTDVWTPALVGTVGAVGISSRVDDLAAFDEERTAMMSDPGFQEIAGRVGSCLAANPEDTLWKIVHVAGERGEVPGVSAIVTWNADPADLEASIGFAVEMAEYQNGVHGKPVVVGTSQWGRPNAVNMVMNYDSVADFEAASNAIQAEGSFLERLKGAVGRPDSIESWVMRRVV